jgi:hypothetical protein
MVNYSTLTAPFIREYSYNNNNNNKSYENVFPELFQIHCVKGPKK